MPDRKTMIGPAPHDPDDARLNRAAEWHARVNGDSSDETTWAAFTVWLEADDANRAAFDRVEDLYAALDEAAEHAPHLLRSETGASQVTGLVPRAAPRMARRFRVGLAVAGTALLAASLAFVLVLNRPEALRPTGYATRIGETRTVSLADGSVVEMNTGSAIAVSLGKTERRVDLDHGEAIFRVAKDPARPFLVTVGDRDIRDVGTVFNVLRNEDRIVVTVAEGEVAVSPHMAQSQAGSDETIRLKAGDQLVVQNGAGRSSMVRHVDPEKAMTWRQGYLTYSDAPLSLVVSDLNRYFPNRILLKDEDTGQYRFSGVLQVDNEDAVLKRLTELVPLAVDRAGDGHVVLRLKPRAE